MNVLALDVGSTMARAVVYDAAGEPIPGGEAKELHGGLTDADQLADAAAGLADRARRAVGRTEAVATSCFWHSLVVLDRAGRPLTPILPWRGTGAADDADALAARLGADAVHGRTGCPLHPSFWPAKLAWLRRTQPDTFAAAARFVSFSEYLHERLVAQSHMGLSMASGTGLWRLDGGWDDELLAALDLDPARLPTVSDEPVGDREPWFPALGDGACANVGAGCVTRERAALTVGTSAAYRTAYASAAAVPRPGLFLYRLDGERVVEGGSLSDGGNLYYWLKETLALDDGDPLPDGPPDSHGLTFVPLLGGERSPAWDARARGAIAGLTFETTARDLLRAGLEGVALRIAEVAERMPEVEEVVATGGAMAANPAWLQVVADAVERPVARSAAKEASARGAAVVALERLGVTPPPPPTNDVFEPRPDAVERLRGARLRQRALADAMKRPPE